MNNARKTEGILNGNTGLKGALYSALFTALRSGNLLVDDHRGGCVLYEKRSQVEALPGCSEEGNC